MAIHNHKNINGHGNDWVTKHMMYAAHINGQDQTLNCWTFIANILDTEFNIYVPTFEGELEEYLVERVNNEWYNIQNEPIQTGDIVYVNRSPIPPHVGIITPESKVLHYKENQAVLESLKSIAWRGRDLEFYRYRTS